MLSILPDLKTNGQDFEFSAERMDKVFKFAGCAAEFKASMRRIATVAGMDVVDVFMMWRTYADNQSDQSPLLSEFVEHKSPELGGDRAALRAAEAGEIDHVEEVTQGRTIWNSDGNDGPVLICAPPATSRRTQASTAAPTNPPASIDETMEALSALGRTMFANSQPGELALS